MTGRVPAMLGHVSPECYHKTHDLCPGAIRIEDDYGNHGLFPCTCECHTRTHPVGKIENVATDKQLARMERLHDAAPDMLALLTDGIRAYDAIPESAGALDSLDLLTSIIEQARALLARIEDGNAAG